MPEIVDFPATPDVKVMAAEMSVARSYGALFHPTNPTDSWFCLECCVFGRGDSSCWSCGGQVQFQWVPRFGGGAQSFSQEAEDYGQSA